MTDWKELKIDNLPADILVGDYEFEGAVKEDPNDWYYDCSSGYDAIGITVDHIVRYRPRQPEPPTHEEIITKWWLSDNKNWLIVTGYTKKLGYFIGASWVDKSYFTNRQSADLPPEN